MTFDDGYKSNYSFAMEVLSKYKIKAIFFIPTKIFDLKKVIQIKLNFHTKT